MDVSRETWDKLQAYLELLRRWQAKINLISNSTLDSAWERHFEDSLQILPFLPPAEAGKRPVLFDLGSGAGFPGLVLAIARPDLAVHLVESDAKKCAFLGTVSRETGAGAVIHNRRIEDMAPDPAPDIVTARALAPLASLLDYSRPWAALNPALSFVFLKGAQADSEVHAARAGWDFDEKSAPSRTDSQGKILLLTNVRPRD